MQINLFHETLYAGTKKLFEVEELSLEPGMLHVLLGDNGAGKTSFFKAILGIGGDFRGKQDERWEPIEGVYLGTHRPQLQYLSVEDFLSFGATELSLRKQGNLMERLNCQFDNRLSVMRLSDGEFKKLSIVRQLSFDPKVIFLDEPTAYLDVRNKDLLGAFLQEESKRRLIVLSTHDLHFAKTFGQTFMRIEGGIISSVEAP